MGFKALLFFICVSFLFNACVRGQGKFTRVYPDFAFDRPVDFQCPPDGSNRVMIVTQAGIIYSIQSGAVPSRNVLLDLTSIVTNKSSELGLLGLAFHPRFKDNGFMYVDYTADNPLRTVIARYTVSPPSSDNVLLASRLVLLEIPQPFENHKGGCLEFGPDGYLYIGMGDGGSAGDPNNNAQNKKALLGKILRLDVNATSQGKSYAIPTGNPFKGNSGAGAEEVYAYGFRNPWRFSFDPVTKKLWVADVGQDKYEEIDTVRAGKNYGWRTMEGKHCYDPPTGCDETGLEMPLWDYGHDASGGWCITGGFVYRGANIPALRGKYVYGDFVAQKLWALSIDAQGTLHNDLLAENAGAITTFGEDWNSELYFCTYDGKIFRIEKSIADTGSEQTTAYDFQLQQNYPNPFNGETVIPFQISEPSHAVLDVYDALGKKVATLADRFFDAGSYSVRWNASQYASGVYSIRLRAGASTAARTIVLQK